MKAYLSGARVLIPVAAAIVLVIQACLWLHSSDTGAGAGARANSSGTGRDDGHAARCAVCGMPEYGGPGEASRFGPSKSGGGVRRRGGALAPIWSTNRDCAGAY
jgi:hypothetical protein